ncbi:U3 small nucleolar RNA-associated protein [Protomyces lactucae-debilis]|uniref:U three protein 7 n=1 Tax=Protomyces lactucae-debilis TaxID=2754530 RepID=A0A1Y2F8X8_PROLT|nr:U3 small nucleolar RNA-associated protein [Protomyces lactucae-debilis]ORY79904.1 U3 small nucleolar RNA-associated protein [Protomyces lactucae-debilis]
MSTAIKAPQGQAIGLPSSHTYSRGPQLQNNSKSKLKDKKLRSQLKRKEAQIATAEEEAAKAELLNVEDTGFLEPESALERTYKFTQPQIRKEVDVATAQKAFDLKLDFGPYACDFTRNGRYLLLGGRKGHIASLDWKAGRMACEFHVKETVKDVAFLHNESLFAVAQKKYTYIYDGSGAEVHCLKHHVEVNALQFLPYHYLLATIGQTGYLKYQDISTGAVVSEHRSKLGPCSVLRQNRQNAILHTGHSNGVVNLWTPNLGEPAVRLLTHRGPVRALCIDREGKYMATAGQDSRIKVWDLRTHKCLQDYFSPRPATSVDFSDTGILATGWSSHVHLWRDVLGGSAEKQASPYMVHNLEGNSVSSVRFAPYEDFLGCAHDSGYASLVVPGAGEANYDAYEANPYMTKQQRRTAEVRGLLEKLQPNMISLQPDIIGSVDPASASVRKQEVVEAVQEAKDKDAAEFEYVAREKQRGRNSALRRVLRKKNKHVVDERRNKVERLLQQEKQMKQDRLKRERGETVEAGPEAGPALSRFAVHGSRRR